MGGARLPAGLPDAGRRAILSAFHRAAYGDGKGLLVKPRGNRGTWYGTDGETRVWIKCRRMPRRAGE